LATLLTVLIHAAPGSGNQLREAPHAGVQPELLTNGGFMGSYVRLAPAWAENIQWAYGIRVFCWHMFDEDDGQVCIKLSRSTDKTHKPDYAALTLARETYNALARWLIGSRTVAKAVEQSSTQGERWTVEIARHGGLSFLTMRRFWWASSSMALEPGRRRACFCETLAAFRGHDHHARRLSFRLDDAGLAWGCTLLGGSEEFCGVLRPPSNSWMRASSLAISASNRRMMAWASGGWRAMISSVIPSDMAFVSPKSACLSGPIQPKSLPRGVNG
jgi:hypothetical protein